MNEYAFLLIVAVTLAAGAMSPGASFFVVARNALSRSRGHGIATSAGTALAVCFFAVLASFGVAALLQQSPKVFLFFSCLGGLYLLYLAYRIWCAAKQPLQMQGENQTGSKDYLSAFLLGLSTQLTNPKTILVIAGIFAALVPANPPAYTVLMVAVIAFVIDFCWYATVSIVLSAERSQSVYQKAKKGFDRTAAVFLALVGLKLLQGGLSYFSNNL